jgi:preprotein translocase subunit YajC
MYSVSQVAEILNVSKRAIQIKCNKHKVPKFENEFQISEVMLIAWKESKGKKRSEVELTSKTSRINRKVFVSPKLRLSNTNAVFFILFLVMVAVTFFYQERSHKEAMDSKNEVVKEVRANMQQQKENFNRTINLIQTQRDYYMIKNTMLQDSLRKFKP